MNLNTEPLKNWFGFSRRERRSSFILLIIIIVVIGLRFMLPESNLKITDITGKYIPEADLTKPAIANSSFSAGGSSGKPVRRSYIKQERGGHNKNDSNSSSSAAVNASYAKYRKNSVSRQRTPIDLNSSDSAVLVSLPGIGPVLSARIIKYRHLLGGFARTEQLKEVYGLPGETYDLIKDWVFADSTVINRININSADFRELSHIHYFERYEVTAILKFRELKGKINNIGDLTDNKLISLEKLNKVRPYLRFD